MAPRPEPNWAKRDAVKIRSCMASDKKSICCSEYTHGRPVSMGLMASRFLVFRGPVLIRCFASLK